jgi:hypothetical protein
LKNHPSGIKLKEVTMSEKSFEVFFKKIDEGVNLAIKESLEKHQKLWESVVVCPPNS